MARHQTHNSHVKTDIVHPIWPTWDMIESLKGFSLVFFVLIYNQVSKSRQTTDNETTETQQEIANTSRQRSVLITYTTDDIVVTVTPLYSQSIGVTDDCFHDQPPSYEEAIKKNNYDDLQINWRANFLWVLSLLRPFPEHHKQRAKIKRFIFFKSVYSGVTH